MELPRSGSSIGSQTAIAAENPHIPSESAGALASLLETIAEGVGSDGLSKGVAELVARGKLCQSTLKVYDSCWNGFTTWCSARRIFPWHATMQQIVDFMRNLFQH